MNYFEGRIKEGKVRVTSSLLVIDLSYRSISCGSPACFQFRRRPPMARALCIEYPGYRGESRIVSFANPVSIVWVPMFDMTYITLECLGRKSQRA
jgi:hypothetical protein